MSAFKAGVLTLVVLVVATYFGFTKANPFANPYELNAVVRDAQNLKPARRCGSPGVEVGKVTKVEAAEDGAAGGQVHDGAARRRAARCTRTPRSRSARASSSRATSSST